MTINLAHSALFNPLGSFLDLYEGDKLLGSGYAFPSKVFLKNAWVTRLLVRGYAKHPGTVTKMLMAGRYKVSISSPFTISIGEWKFSAPVCIIRGLQ